MEKFTKHEDAVVGTTGITLCAMTAAPAALRGGTARIQRLRIEDAAGTDLSAPTCVTLATPSFTHFDSGAVRSHASAVPI